MGIIYKEVIRGKRGSFLSGLMVLFLLTLVVNLLVNSGQYSSKYNIEMEIFLITGILLGLFVLKKIFDMLYFYRISYTYKLIDKELIFEREIGKSKKVILSVDIKHVEEFGRLKDLNNLKNIDKTYKFLCCPSKSNIYCCVVNEDGRRIRFYFQPSPELVRKIRIVMGTV